LQAFFFKSPFLPQNRITAETLEDKLLRKSEKSRMLIEIFKDHNRKMSALIGNGNAHGTLARYETSLMHIQSFINWKSQAFDTNAVGPLVKSIAFKQ